MNSSELLNQGLINTVVQIPLLDFAINIVLAFIMAFLLGILYSKYGVALSNR